VTTGIPAAAVAKAIDDLITALVRGLDNLPLPLIDGSAGAERAAQMRTIIRGRLDTFD
jgi:serine/threonine-protein kinase HipA